MKLIVLDRDGVINEDHGSTVTTVDEWHPIDGSLEAIARLHQSDYQVAVVTNQSGIARGVLTLEDLYAIHRKMHDAVTHAGGKIDVILFCPHSDKHECSCRKPMPGMLYSLSERLDVDLTKVQVVGDSLRDVQAAMAAAAQPIIVKTGKGQVTVDNNKGLEHIPAFDDLAAFVDHLIKTENETD